MNQYLELDLDALIAGKEYPGLMQNQTIQKHIARLTKPMQSHLKSYVQELEDDHELKQQTLVEAQEKAGWADFILRKSFGGLFNRLFFLSILEAGAGAPGPQGKLKEQIEKDFGSFDDFKTAFKEAVDAKYQPGWVWLCYSAEGQLVIKSTNNEDNTLMNVIYKDDGGQLIPVLGLDLWEHAYIEEHNHETSTYVDGFWQNLNWSKISDHFENFVSQQKVAPII